MSLWTERHESELLAFHSLFLFRSLLFSLALPGSLLFTLCLSCYLSFSRSLILLVALVHSPSFSLIALVLAFFPIVSRSLLFACSPSFSSCSLLFCHSLSFSIILYYRSHSLFALVLSCSLRCSLSFSLPLPHCSHSSFSLVHPALPPLLSGH